MQKYRSHKIVEAAKIENIGLGTAFSMLYLSSETRRMPNEWMEKHEPKIGGYFVCYPDGYESYSPAEAFEFGYTAVDEDPPGPKAIVINNNQSGDTFIGQTPPHATLAVGTELYTAPPAAAKKTRDPAITALRDHMATEVLKSILLSPEFHGTKEDFVTLAYEYADLMLAESAK